MIHCIRFADFVAYVAVLGFVQIGRVEGARVFARGSDTLSVREPNLNGDLTEITANDVLDNAELPVPIWTTHWCD